MPHSGTGLGRRGSQNLGRQPGEGGHQDILETGQGGNSIMCQIQALAKFDIEYYKQMILRITVTCQQFKIENVEHLSRPEFIN